ncbi:hypothetical protein Zm00014a_013837 [Zea mays]|jgi:hypothetical protein|uniref:Late embryogenesis abundant protein LEA-2 subgroup domain-containing protein n=2 Tax=Zea mays TaxID=4577 RepID=A0A1D6LK11_MAIZE|nr:hypothetical protein ZEAMMB73_Zm00001d035980 [Zea mays]PWZ17451.1 hypothetical protein Zm00014a_013837 [Zea mays]
MAAAGGEGDNGEKSGFRCLDAARYVAAAVVIVLIVAVVVNAIKVVARPDNISVLVLGSSVTTHQMTTQAGKDLVSFEFTLRAVNPSGRVRLNFYDILAYIFDNSTLASATTSTPADDCSILVNTANITLKPRAYVDNTKTVILGDDPTKIRHSFFQALNKPGGRVVGATMRVDGSLVSETGLGFSTSAPRRIVLYCRDLIVGPVDKAATATQETTCTAS